MGILIVLLFVAVLAGCVWLDGPILYALGAGWVLFFGYGLMRRQPAVRLLRVSLEGIRTVRTILFLFLLMGMMTALWRSAGTIPVLISYAVDFIQPAWLLLLCFLFNCLIAVLTGTAFGTAATMGVISMSIANTMQLDPVWTGGAILSGVYFGDRWSPVSTSALLVAEITGTELYGNLQRMLAVSWGPFLLSSAIYAAIGFYEEPAGPVPAVRSLFAAQFSLHWAAALPALLLVVLALRHVPVRQMMLASIVCAAAVSLLLQHTPADLLLRELAVGYHASGNPELSHILDGGGILSMLNVTAVVMISSSYIGLFRATGLLDGIRRELAALGRRSPYGAVLLTSFLAGLVACNQTLTILLTQQLCDGLYGDARDMALALEDTAVVVAPLIPWSIAGAVPLAMIGSSAACILAAVYLYLLPLWNLLLPRRRYGEK